MDWDIQGHKKGIFFAPNIVLLNNQHRLLFIRMLWFVYVGFVCVCGGG